jgi:hypothetical protein
MTHATDLCMEDLNSLCEFMSGFAKMLTPVKTGNNKRSISIDPAKKNGQTPVARVFTTSGYGGWLEIGTSKMAARPYMGPAFDAAKTAQRTKR